MKSVSAWHPGVQTAVNREQRDHIRRTVLLCRRTLEQEFDELLRQHGLMPDRRLPRDLLPAERQNPRAQLDEAIEREGESYPEARRRWLRHAAFTFLNRLLALRLAEAHGLIPETVVTRPQYGNRSLRERDLADHDPILGANPDRLWRRAWEDALAELDIPLLTPRKEDPYSILTPRLTAYRKVRQAIGAVPEEVCKEFEVLGWAYQYFNDEERAAIGPDRRRNPNPDDIPVINQFYTVGWIVQFLVQNTLGRLWLEAHPGSSLAKKLDYLVPLAGNPSRDKQVLRVEEVKVLDPACGSGHFLLYAFDLLFEMWREAHPEIPAWDIPARILEGNLYGVDIDLRACQIAALALYLKARATFERHKAPGARFRPTRLNIVCADTRFTDGGRRGEFLSLFEGGVRRVVKEILDATEHGFQIGSLLRVRQPIEDALKECALRPPGAPPAQLRFFDPGAPVQEHLALRLPKQHTLDEVIKQIREYVGRAAERSDMGSMFFGMDAERAVHLVDVLTEHYDVVVMNPPYGRMPPRCKEHARRYFPRTHRDYYAAFTEQAVDLAKPGGYVGALTGRTFMFLRSYQQLREEILRDAALPELVLDLGFDVLDGATARWAAFTLRRRRPEDGTEWQKHPVTFFRLTPREWKWDQKRVKYEEALAQVRSRATSSNVVYTVTLGELAELPGTAYAYWAPPALREAFQKYPPLDRDLAGRLDQPKIADLRVGLSTSDDLRFIRYWWEVPVEQIATSREETLQGKKWVPFAKGGRPFYHDIITVVNWENDGEEIKRFRREDGRLLSCPRNEAYYFRAGLAWARIASSVMLDAWLLQDAIFSVSALAGFVQSGDEGSILAYLNSGVAAFLLHLIQPLMHDRSIGYVSRLPIPSRVQFNHLLSELAREAHGLLRAWSFGNETSPRFVVPWVLQVWRSPGSTHPATPDLPPGQRPALYPPERNSGLERDFWSLKSLASRVVRQETLLRRRVDDIQEQIDAEVCRIYGLTNDDMKLVREELASEDESLALELETGEDPGGSTGEPQVGLLTLDEHVRRMLHYFAHRAIAEDPDGIVPLSDMYLADGQAEPGLLSRVRKLLAEEFGPENLESVEDEAAEMIGKPLAAWLSEDFFGYHVGLYRLRPILWQVSSENFARTRGRAPAFACFVYWHKLDKDTMYKVQQLYLRPILSAAQREAERLQTELSRAGAADRRARRRLEGEYQEQRDRLEELVAFDRALTRLLSPWEPVRVQSRSAWVREKVNEIVTSGYRPVRDYGVRVNIEPLKMVGIVPREADRVRG